MKKIPVEFPCPPHLEDEALLVEQSGELPELALQESLMHTGPWDAEEELAMRAAAVRAYLAIIRRDLDPANLGRACFRGLERALVNLGRLERFLGREDWELPEDVRDELGEALGRYLEAEGRALAGGRSYASAEPEVAARLLERLGREPERFAGVLELMAGRPAPDFLGLVALRRLAASGVVAKRRRREGPAVVLELLGADGQVLRRARLPWLGPGGGVDPEARRRVELVWAALEPPAVEGD